MVKFIHAADLHLDSPFIGLKSLPEFIWNAIYLSTFSALTKIVDSAITNQVDFICLVGDIYDTDERSVKAQAYLRNEMERLNSMNIPVYLLHGNHDYIENTGLHLDMPQNVFLFNETVETKWLTTKEGEQIAITGFSYDKRWVLERKIVDYPEKNPRATYQLGLLHGFSEGIDSEHGKYAPFSLVELKSKKYDYWALGHIHKRQQLATNPPIVYPGNTQGRSSKESGEKGFELVKMSESGIVSEFCPSATIQWKTIELSVKDKKNLDEVYKAVKESVAEQKNDSYSLFLSIRLTDSESLLEGVIKKIKQGELVEALQQIPKADPFVWVHKIELESVVENHVPAIQKLFPDEWIKVKNELEKEFLFNETTNPLFDFPGMEEIIETREERYRKKIMTNAKELVRNQLGFERSDKFEN
ncbi:MULTISPECIES: metallophosphoesterase family protein [Carnobacterium]|uniref:Exonuclease n=1 Tax=Carnobacterium inhibens subsp. gilichinskyi TaxID=1266845 RepID=U5SBT9_9LACT|nr:DNA repair exonuclease [Carnobacterium inhibens]AGY81297.1 exonuclease [Carnobacterium inhibens subsp. gilichinskyi]